MQETPQRRTLQEIRQELALARQREQRIKEQVRFHLSEIMGRHRIKQTALAEASGLRLATVHALYHEQTGIISKSVLAKILTGLRKLTGEKYDVRDLISFEEVKI